MWEEHQEDGTVKIKGGYYDISSIPPSLVEESEFYDGSNGTYVNLEYNIILHGFILLMNDEDGNIKMLRLNKDFEVTCLNADVEANEEGNCQWLCGGH